VLQFDTDAKALIEFNKKIKSDNRVRIILLPFRDGMMMMLRKSNPLLDKSHYII